jgi:hypothetical protein
MKYTRYIMNESVDFSSVGSAAIPAAALAIPLLTGFLCGAVLMDGGRIVKLHYLLFKREQRKLNYIKCVLISLDRVPNNQLIGLLKAA